MRSCLPQLPVPRFVHAMRHSTPILQNLVTCLISGRKIVKKLEQQFVTSYDGSSVVFRILEKWSLLRTGMTSTEPEPTIPGRQSGNGGELRDCALRAFRNTRRTQSRGSQLVRDWRPRLVGFAALGRYARWSIDCIQSCRIRENSP